MQTRELFRTTRSQTCQVFSSVNYRCQASLPASQNPRKLRERQNSGNSLLNLPQPVAKLQHDSPSSNYTRNFISNHCNPTETIPTHNQLSVSPATFMKFQNFLLPCYSICCLTQNLLKASSFSPAHNIFRIQFELIYNFSLSQ
jgi:hypothetical protein